jgi:hypothetical protein
MGGFGSGQRSYSKATNSDYGRLDVRDWQRRGLLVVGRAFLNFPWDVEVIATMKRDEPNMVCLYHWDRSARQREPYRVLIEWTPCNYGGKRAWFVCPRGCGHRVAILYGNDTLVVGPVANLPTKASKTLGGIDHCARLGQPVCGLVAPSV